MESIHESIGSGVLEAAPSIVSLPTELLAGIFNRLSLEDACTVSLVNRRFYEVLRGSSKHALELGKSSFRFFANAYVNERYSNQPSSGNFSHNWDRVVIRHISLSHGQLTDQTLLLLVRKAEMIRSLELNNTYIIHINPSSVEVLYQFQNLSYLDLRELHISTERINVIWSRIIYSLSFYERLEELHLRDNSLIPTELYPKLFETLANLTRLQVFDFSFAQMSEVEAIKVSESLSLFSSCKSLDFTFEDFRLGESSIIMTIRKLRSLESLSFNPRAGHSVDVFHELFGEFRTFQNLTKFEFAGGLDEEDYPSLQMIPEIPNLEELGLISSFQVIDLQLLTDIINRSEHLQMIDLTGLDISPDQFLDFLHGLQKNPQFKLIVNYTFTESQIAYIQNFKVEMGIEFQLELKPELEDYSDF